MSNSTLSLISQNWFLSEPAFYSLYCLQQLEENVRMECTFRCGQGKIQYNPLLLNKLNYKQAEQQLRIELIRLFLGHPYQRQPQGCSHEARALGSDCTIADGYCMLREKFPLQGPDFYHLPLGEHYEFYAKEIQKLHNKDNDGSNQNTTASQNKAGQSDSSSGPNGQSNVASTDTANSQTSQNKDKSDQSGLWEEDALRSAQLHDLIARTNDWGTIPADIVTRIEASTKARLNPNLVMEGFRSTVLSQQRQLTRMRPNRRTQFLQMGSTRQFDTRILIGVDVSGSISDETLSDFYSSILRLFRYGIAQIDTVQFDAALGDITPLECAKRTITVTGRGGTDFQPIIDLATERQRSNTQIYDGLLIFTDGQAPPPQVPARHLPILWVTPTEADWRNHHLWMDHSGRSCWLNI